VAINNNLKEKDEYLKDINRSLKKGLRSLIKYYKDSCASAEPLSSCDDTLSFATQRYNQIEGKKKKWTKAVLKSFDDFDNYYKTLYFEHDVRVKAYLAKKKKEEEGKKKKEEEEIKKKEKRIVLLKSKKIKPKTYSEATYYYSSIDGIKMVSNPLLTADNKSYHLFSNQIIPVYIIEKIEDVYIGAIGQQERFFGVRIKAGQEHEHKIRTNVGFFFIGKFVEVWKDNLGRPVPVFETVYFNL
jgi:hypothetical protein